MFISTNAAEISKWFTYYVAETRRKDGSEYPPKTIYVPGFLSGFGPRGGKTAICNLVGGHGSLNMHST